MQIPCPAVDEIERSAGSVFRMMLAEPFKVLVVKWNWKAAVLSAAARAPVFLLTTLGHGWRRAGVAVLVETTFRISTAGLFAAAIQAFRNAQPVWAAVLIILVAIPLVSLVLDGLLHAAMGTPSLVAGLAVSILVSAVSSIFNWYVMCRGTLLIGQGASPFWSDLKAFPLLVVGFLLAPIRWVLRSEVE